MRSSRPSDRSFGRTLLLLAAVVLGGCSCPTDRQAEPLPDPVLPAGEPPDTTALLLEREAGWIYSPGPDGHELTLDDTVTMPAVDLEDLLTDRKRERAYIEALKKAGRWRP